MILVLFTGPPCSGKSLTMDGFIANFTEGDGVAAVNDYSLFQDWAAIDENRRFLEPLGEDNFDLRREAYPLISVYASQRAAQKAARLYRDGKKVIAIEGARGAHGMDNYQQHFLEPLVEVLGREGIMIEGIVNFAVDGGSREVLEERALVRFEANRRLAPPGTASKYFDEEGNPFSNSLAEVAAFTEREGIRLFLNSEVRNHLKPDELTILVEGMRRDFIEATGFMGRFSEGQCSINPEMG